MPETPEAWLWKEVAVRFGDAAAAHLRADYNAQRNAYQLAQRLAAYRAEIDTLTERIAIAEARGNETALIRSLERKIAHRRAYLAEHAE